MSRGALALFGWTAPSSTAALKTITDKYQVPLLTWSHPILKKANESDHEYELESEEETSENEEPDHKYLFTNSDLHKKYESVDEITNLATLRKYNEIKNAHARNFQVHMHPDMVPMLISLIKYNRWKIIYYVYNHEEGGF